jgi:hypothetical protein
MYRAQEFQTIGLLALGLAAIFAIARGFWLYRASLTWPTADGVITRFSRPCCESSARKLVQEFLK